MKHSIKNNNNNIMVKPFFGIKQQHQLDKCTDFCKVQIFNL